MAGQGSKRAIKRPSPRLVNATGIIIGRQRFGDTSLILRWLTPMAGRITTMVKGAYSEKSPFRHQLDLYYECDFSYSLSRRGEMHSLREMVLKNPHLNLRKSWTTLLTLDYFSGLIGSVTESESALPEDYALFMQAVAYLNDHAASERLLHRYEQKLLSIHGFPVASQQDFEKTMREHHFRLPAGKARLLREL